MFRGQHSTVPPTRGFSAVQLYQGLVLVLRSALLDVVSKSRLKSTLYIGVGTGGHRGHVPPPPAHGEGASHVGLFVLQSHA